MTITIQKKLKLQKQRKNNQKMERKVMHKYNIRLQEEKEMSLILDRWQKKMESKHLVPLNVIYSGNIQTGTPSYEKQILVQPNVLYSANIQSGNPSYDKILNEKYRGICWKWW